MDSREEIRSKLSIVDLVSEYVELKKAGRNFKGLCPFHSEKSPSFIVSPDKEIAYCFGCHKGGDIFAFYQEVEGVDFVDALKELGNKVGVVVQQISATAVKKNKSKRERLLEMHIIANELFQENLWNTEEGKKVQEYLINRGVSKEIIKKYNLGFSLDSFDSLYKILLEKGFNKSEIVSSGLAIAKDTDVYSIFDRFRLRLMFPIFSREGKVIGFGGRALRKEDSPKYLNSPETDIYYKSEVLFGLNFAKDEIRKTETVILVEGYFDQIALMQAGYKNVVSISGTALTPRHLQLLKKTAKNLIFCLDNDAAGENALYRSAELALLESFNIKVIDLKEFKDPGELLQKDPSLFTEVLESAMDLFDWILEIEFFKVDEKIRHEVDSINNLMEKALPLINKITSDIIQDVIIRKFSNATNVKIDAFYSELTRLKQTKKQIIPTNKTTVKEAPTYSIEEYFWGYLFWEPELFVKIYDLVKDLAFIFTENDIYKTFLAHYNNDRDFKEFYLSETDLIDALKEKYSIITVYLESIASSTWDKSSIKTELKKLFVRLKEEYKKKESNRLLAAIRQAEKNANDEELRKILEQYRKVLSI